MRLINADKLEGFKFVHVMPLLKPLLVGDYENMIKFIEKRQGDEK